MKVDCAYLSNRVLTYFDIRNILYDFPWTAMDDMQLLKSAGLYGRYCK